MAENGCAGHSTGPPRLSSFSALNNNAPSALAAALSNAPSTATTTDGSRRMSTSNAVPQASNVLNSASACYVKRPLVRTVSEVDGCSVCSSSPRSDAEEEEQEPQEEFVVQLYEHQLKKRGLRPPTNSSLVVGGQQGVNATMKRKPMQRCKYIQNPVATLPPPPPPRRPPSTDVDYDDNFWDNDDENEEVFLPSLVSNIPKISTAAGSEKTSTAEKKLTDGKVEVDKENKSAPEHQPPMKCIPNLYTQPPEMIIHNKSTTATNSTITESVSASAALEAAPPLPQRRCNNDRADRQPKTSDGRSSTATAARTSVSSKMCAKRQHSSATIKAEPPYYYQASKSRRRFQNAASHIIERNAASRFQQVYQQRRHRQRTTEEQRYDGESNNFRSFSVAAQPIYVVHGANGQPIFLQQAQQQQAEIAQPPPRAPIQVFQQPFRSADLLVPMPTTTKAPELRRHALPAPPPPPITEKGDLYSSYDKALHQQRSRQQRQAAARKQSSNSEASASSEIYQNSAELAKQRAFWSQLSKVGSMTYAVMVTVLGCILYINDVLGTVDHNYVEVFQVYLFMMAITFFMFLHIDIRRFLKHERNIERHREQTMDVALRQVVASQIPPSTGGAQQQQQMHYNLPTSNLPRAAASSAGHQQSLSLPQPYLFRTGRHAGSMYLKLGAIGKFTKTNCLNMIHDGLVFSKRLDLIMTPGEIACLNIIDLFTPVLNLIFSFYQLYFVFKLANVVVNRYHVWASFGFMHAIACNICVWFRTLVDETMQEFSRKITKTAAKLSAEAQKYVQERFIADNYHDPNSSPYDFYGQHHFAAAPTPPTTHMTTNSNYHQNPFNNTNSKLDQRLGIFPAASIISQPQLFHENNPLIPSVLKAVVDSVNNNNNNKNDSLIHKGHAAIKQHTEFLYYYSHLANNSGITFNDEYECVDDTFLSKIAREAAPYLYPFSIEYSLIAAAVCYTIWAHIGRVHTAAQCTPASPADVARTAARLFRNHQQELADAHPPVENAHVCTNNGGESDAGCIPSTASNNEYQRQQAQHRSTMALYSAAAALAVGHANANHMNSSHYDTPKNCADKQPRGGGDNNEVVDPLYMHLNEICIKASRYDVQVDCRSTNRGLFPGILVMVFTVISIIIFFVTIPTKEYADTAVMINNISELCLTLITAFAIAFAFQQTFKLDVDEHSHGHTLDDFLLYIPLPCFFIHNFFSIIAGLAENNWLSIMCDVLCLVQVIMQTTFIFDGLRRCAKSAVLQSSKPGRELITFLIVCNVAMWTFATFEIKRTETNPSQLNFYGVFEWGLITHLSVPLTIFYRFHSSACLVDIWRAAYQPPERH